MVVVCVAFCHHFLWSHNSVFAFSKFVHVFLLTELGYGFFRGFPILPVTTCAWWPLLCRVWDHFLTSVPRLTKIFLISDE